MPIKRLLVTLIFFTPLSFGKINFDLSKIYELSANPGPGDSHPHPPPYFVHFKKGEKEIFYLSAKHSTKVDGQTHKIIDHVLKKYSIDASIVELQTHDQSRVDELIRTCKEKLKCFEGIYLYMKSKVIGVEVNGGEPTDLDIKKVALGQGMTKKELLFFFSYRGVASWRQGDPDRAHHPKKPLLEISRYIENSKRRLKLKGVEFELKDFLHLYKLKMGKKFNYTQTSYEDIAPYRDGHYIQKLSLKVDLAREVNILKTLEKMINKYDVVFIVYGSGHYLKHRPVIKDIFKDWTVVNIR